MVAIEVEDVSKRFRLRTVEAHTTLKSACVDLVLGRRRPKGEARFQVLQGVSLTVDRGRTLGIIGRNGSGKSTLLKLLAGILRPDRGRIRVRGKVSALLELGAGFHPEFSGRENVFINGIILGLSKREVRRRFEAIVRFAELEDFIDAPVRTYSSGMYMRLAFAIAVHTDPDILLIDEILAVGDEAFQQKCHDQLAEFQRQGKSIVIVSHDLPAVERWCDEAVWLDGGIVRERGAPKAVMDGYLRAIGHRTADGPDQARELPGADAEREAGPSGTEGMGPPRPTRPAPSTEAAGGAAEPAGARTRWGSGEVEFVSVRLLDRAGRERADFRSGEEAIAELRYRVHAPVADAVFGIAIVRADGVWCYGTNTGLEGRALPPLGPEGVVEVILEGLHLIGGDYYLDVAVHRSDGAAYDYHSRLHPFSIRSEVPEIGICRIPHRWVIRAGALSCSTERGG